MRRAIVSMSISCAVLSGAAHGAPSACRSIVADAARLACYDAADRSLNSESTMATLDPRAVAAVLDSSASRPRAVRSTLDEQWLLRPDESGRLFALTAYRPMYVLPLFQASRANPSPTPNWPVPVDTAAVVPDTREAKFQISFKLKVIDDVFGAPADLWFGYTQSSRWQIFGDDAGNAFRETDYEPEAILAIPTDYSLLGWHGRLLSVGIDHQSNGRGGVLSRSWDRAIVGAAFERGAWTLSLRQWTRFDSRPRGYDNPGIENYVGRADAVLTRDVRGHRLSALARHSLRDGDKSHGAMGFSWSFPLVSNLHGFVEVFDGYGESLLDYDFRARYFGVGVMLQQW